MHNYLLCLEYDGYDYHGWVKQNNKKGVQNFVEQKIEKLIKHKNFKLVATSKTDAKVHAKMQLALFTIEHSINLITFKNNFNRIEQKDIILKNIEEVDNNFNIHNFKAKVYEYIISKKPLNAFNHRYMGYIENIDEKINKLKEILNIFIGEHNFFNFSGLSVNEKEKIQSIRLIDEINVFDNKENVIIQFRAKGFIRYQIRKILGASFAYINNLETKKNIIDCLNIKIDKLKWIADGQGLYLAQVIK